MKSSVLRKAVAVSAAVMLAVPAMANAATVTAPTTPDSNTVLEAPREQTKGNGPEVKNFVEASMETDSQNAAPAGANDWNCKPSKAHPNPVVLVHGWGSNAYNTFAAISPMLKKNGFCVFATNYGKEKEKSLVGNMAGFNGLGDTWTSAMQVRDFVDAVRAATGAKKVDMIGWSQGGLIVQTYINFYTGGNRQNPALNKVEHAIYMGGAHHGTTMSGLANLVTGMHEAGMADVIDPIATGVGGKAIPGMLMDSKVVKANREAGDTVPGIHYTIISSEKDMVVTPIENTWLKQGPGATVNNVSLTKGCAENNSDHHAMIYDPRAFDYILMGLGVQNVRPRCVPTTQFIAAGF